MSVEASIVNWAKADSPEMSIQQSRKTLWTIRAYQKNGYDPSLGAKEAHRDIMAEGPAGTCWGFRRGQDPILGDFSNGWDDNYTRKEAKREDEVEDEEGSGRNLL